MPDPTHPARLTDQQCRDIESIDVEQLLSAERIAELHSLIKSGYPNSAIICAIREAAYALRTGIVIPPTLRE